MLIPQQGIHVQLNRNGQHIQIGDSLSDCHRFTIEIHWQHCEWLSYVSGIPYCSRKFSNSWLYLYIFNVIQKR